MKRPPQVPPRWLAVGVGCAGMMLITCIAQGCRQDASPPPKKTSPTTTSETTTATNSAGITSSTPAKNDVDEAVRTDVSAWVGEARRAAIGDVTGDGQNEVVLVDHARLRLVLPDGKELASAPIRRGVHTLHIATLSDDESPVIVAGWGRSMEHRDAKSRVSVFQYSNDEFHEQIVVEPATERHQIAETLSRPDGSLLVAWFESKYVVKSAVATPSQDGSWSLATIASIRMASSYAEGDVDGDGQPDLVVGRSYGDDIGVDGDAFVLREDGSRTHIPTLRGVRALLVHDFDDDGRSEVFLGDGWHQNYRKRAEARLSVSRWSDGSFETETLHVHDGPNEYAIEEIVAANSSTIVVRTNTRVHIHMLREGDWTSVDMGEYRAVAVGNLDAGSGDDILLIGDTSHRVNLDSVSRNSITSR